MFYGSESTWQWGSGAYGVLPNMTWTQTRPGQATIAWFTALSGWQNLVPDLGSALLTSSRGTKLSALPSGGGARPLQHQRPPEQLPHRRGHPGREAGPALHPGGPHHHHQHRPAGPGYTAQWVDPYTGARISAATPASSYTTPGTNSHGDDNWYLLLEESSGSDNQPPDTSITGGPAEAAPSTTTPRRSPSPRPRRVRRSSAAWMPRRSRPVCTPFTSAALADGAHTFEVRATDPANNTDTDTGEPDLQR